MKDLLKYKKLLFINIILFFVVFLAVFTWSNISKGPSSLANITEEQMKWDGKTVSTHFSGGNGTIDNPYQIGNGADFAYFKQVIESVESSEFNTKYYILTDDIHLGDQVFEAIGTIEKPFQGVLNGDGYSLSNFKQDSAKVIEDKDYYGLFVATNDAVIKHLNIKEVDINVVDSENKIEAATFIANMTKTELSHLSFTNIKLNVEEISLDQDLIIGGVVGTMKEECQINNGFFDIDINSKHQVGRILGINISDSNKLTNAIIHNSVEKDNTNLTVCGKNEIETENNYFSSFVDGILTIKKSGNIQTIKEVVDYFNQELPSTLNWTLEDQLLVVKRKEQVNTNKSYTVSNNQFQTFRSFSPNATGILGNTVYINDIEADYNYYMGKNYTEPFNDQVRDGNKQDLYTDQNLVKVMMVYDGVRTLNNKEQLRGTVSLTEQQDSYVYYKVYPVDNNGTSNLDDDYVRVDLIDNPFTSRPDDKGLNAWITDYPGAKIYHDSETYQRYVTIPVTYFNGTPNEISITMNASWKEASIHKMSTSTTWTTVFNNLKAATMTEVVDAVDNVRDPFDMTGYFLRVTVPRYGSLVGYYSSNGTLQTSGTCNTSSGCTYYERIDNQVYEDGTTYYRLTSSMVSVTASSLPFTYTPVVRPLYENMNMSGHFYRKVISNGQSLVGLYNQNGALQKSGTCTSSTCTYYEMIQYYDEYNQEEVFDQNKTYYYLPTRDTNLVVLDRTISTNWGTNAKPFSLIGIFNGQDYSNTYQYTVTGIYLRAYGDVNIENVKLYNTQAAVSDGTPPSGTATTRNFFGQFQNVKIGRGIKQNANYKNFNNFVGGNNSTTGSNNNPTRYTMIVESGAYNIITLGNSAGTSANYINGKAIYGSDYDRANNNNNNLDVYFCASGSWGGNVYASTNNVKSQEVALSTTVKSGTFGSGKYDYSTGIYVGGRGYGTHYATREIYYEGGYAYNVIGGPLTWDTRAGINDVFMYIKGGEIDMITGGAGRSATFGNRIIQLTGGQVNYSVFGGSNGYVGSNTEGMLNGDTFLYAGGNSVIGSDTYVNNNSSLFGAEAGSVFGIGNGRSGTSYEKVGSCDNSTIIIDAGTTIKQNVYGGGNYGAVGVNSTSSSTKTNINMYGGTISGDIYGGGNRNGSGASNKMATIKINMLSGILNGSIYGGSNETGTIYGDVNVNVNGGTIAKDVYGGGKGGYINASNPGTSVTGNSDVTIGDKNISTSPLITGSVFGGSAYGTVNGSSPSAATSNKNTKVTINKGTIQTAVFGGGRGNSTYSPTVHGNIEVTVEDGNIASVYGGNDAAGIPRKDVKVYLNGGTIGSAYGGGNNSSVDLSYIYLRGSNLTYLFGGSNASGNVITSNVFVEDGTVYSVYGGNNIGGSTGISQVNLLGGTISESVYGGGKYANTTTTNIINRGIDVSSIYGGGESANVSVTNVTIEDGTIDSLFGGSNTSGTVITSNINVIKGTLREVYGGNNIGGTTNNTSVNIVGGTIASLYGGGNRASTNTNLVKVRNAFITNLYGGGNEANTNNSIELEVHSSTILDTIYGGGNQGDVIRNTTLLVENTNVYNNVYGGGNAATVFGSTIANISGNTKVGNNVFAGGNSGAIGEEDVDTSTATLNITGVQVEGHVYGGCNTSVVYGKTKVNIGSNVVNNSNLIKDDISIKGTVFGGGEANAEGSENYDYTFICVTKAIDILIDGAGYLNNDYSFSLSGSIFGSGNASSSKGTSDIYISNLGTKENPSRNISIQRADNVVIDHSYMELSGTTDRTNEYSSIKYSFNRIDLLKIKNSTTLLLQQNANLLKELQSLVDQNGEEKLATVFIDDETKKVTKNTDNRIYVVANRNLNVTTNEAATSYGAIKGMAFFGMYNTYSNGSIQYGLYDSSVDYGDSADAGDVIVGGSYVLGLHSLNHDITKNGFYTNYIDDTYTEITTAYIEPTPPDANYYMWTIGLQAINYNFALTASKYSSLGTHELSMREFSSGNTTFNVIGFNSEGLTSGVELKDSNDVPKVAATPEDANSILGLSMKTETTEWTGHGTTKYLTANNGSSTGQKSYKTDNVSSAPSLMFYLYHAKNISRDDDLGSVVISLQAMTPINEIEYDVQLIMITIDLDARNYDDGDFYDASITYDKKYEMPAATNVNITNDSQFTAYYSLYAEANSLASFYGVNNDYYHTITTNYALPVGTRVTMIDYGVGDDTPEYYYLDISASRYQQALLQLQRENEVTYPLAEFIKMGSVSSNNTYNDKKNNQKYFHSNYNLVMEEYIFIVDFKETNVSGTHLNNSFLMELRNNEDRTITPVLGIRQPLMYYNTHDSTNVLLDQHISFEDSYLYYNLDNNVSYQTGISYDQTENRDSIINTNYESSKMGINLMLYDSSNNIVSSSLLLGSVLRIDRIDYFADSDGVFKVKLADKVSNIAPKMSFMAGNNLPAGIYKFKFDLFASEDGIHNSGDLLGDTKEITITVVGDNNLITAKTDDHMKVVDGNTSLNLLGTKIQKYQLYYDSELTRPNIRLSIQKRNISDENTTIFEEYDARELFQDTLSYPEGFGLTRKNQFEYLISIQPNRLINLDYELADGLTSGTYRLEFRLYDQNQLIDSDIEYMIVKKKV